MHITVDSTYIAIYAIVRLLRIESLHRAHLKDINIANDQIRIVRKAPKIDRNVSVARGKSISSVKKFWGQQRRE
jgi:hypothetical protein